MKELPEAQTNEQRNERTKEETMKEMNEGQN